MTTTAGAASLLEAARSLESLIRRHADEADRERRLTQPVVEALHDAGLFSMIVPRALGGAELDATAFLQVVEEVSRIDGSTGWCLMVGAEGIGSCASWLGEDVAREILEGEPYSLVAASATPGQQGLAVDGGYRVSGHWRFASGCRHATWLFADFTVFDGDSVRRKPNGAPLVLFGTLQRSAAEIIDAWSVSGLRGTGSDDFAVRDLYVPSEYTFDMLDEPPLQPSPIFLFPRGAFLAMSKAVVTTGIARGAIDAFLELAASKKPLRGLDLLRDEPRIQMDVAEAEATLRSAQAFLFQSVAETWETVVASGGASLQQAALVRLASVYAAREAARAVEIVARAAGTSSIFRHSPLERAFRDVHVPMHHYNVVPQIQEDVGRVLLGLPPKLSYF